MSGKTGPRRRKPRLALEGARVCLAMVLSVLLSAPTGAQSAGTAGNDTFKPCAVCHTLEVGKHKVGPSLANLLGRKAGTLERYSYSKAMKDSGITWDATTLDVYLTNPRAVVPGTKMTFPGIKAPEARARLIDHLLSAVRQD